MKKYIMFACIFLLWSMLSSCNTQKTGKILAEVNGHKITTTDLELLSTINPNIKVQLINSEGKKKILDSYIEQELLYQEAVKRGINRRPDVEDKVVLFRKAIIAQAFLNDLLEMKAKKYYEDHPKEFDKLRMSQIMIRYSSPEAINEAKKKGKLFIEHKTENEALKTAKLIKTRLDNGEDFATVAIELSEEMVSKPHGGDVGLVSKNDFVYETLGFTPLLEKAFTMKVGEIAGPIKTRSGYHIITVTRGVETQSFAEAKPEIVKKTQLQEKSKLVQQLKAASKIVYFEDGKKLPQEPNAIESPSLEKKAPVDTKTTKPGEIATPATPTAKSK